MKKIRGAVFLCLLSSLLAMEGAGGCGGGGTLINSFSLTLLVTGAGKGAITSNTGDLNCSASGGACQADLPAGSQVILTPTPNSGFFFNGWSGGNCSGIKPCQITLNSDLTIRASFVGVAYWSSRATDRSAAANAPNFTSNIWVGSGMGDDGQALTKNTGTQSYSASPRWSPDGNLVAYLSQRNLTDFSTSATGTGVNNIWISKADGSGGDTALTKNTGANTNALFPAWSPDGTKVAYVSGRDPNNLSPSAPGLSGVYNIWLVNGDGSGGDKAMTQNTVSGSFSTNPSWSPDGTKIVFSSKLDWNNLSPSAPPLPANNIWVINADGTNPVALTKNTLLDFRNQEPMWSPDGTQVVFSSTLNLNNPADDTTPNPTSNIWVMNADGSNPRHLTSYTTLNTNNNNPQWSPDGKTILYDSHANVNGGDSLNPNSNLNIWSVNADGTGSPAPLTRLLGSSPTTVNSFSAFFAPDNSAIIYQSNRNLDPTQDASTTNKNNNVWIMNPDGSNPKPLTDLDVLDADSYSPIEEPI